MRDLYHGSIYDIDVIDVTKGKGYKELAASDYADDLLDALIRELEPENLPKQYFFGTRAAIQKLKFKKIRKEIVG